jgi:hypothetical protein
MNRNFSRQIKLTDPTMEYKVVKKNEPITEEEIYTSLHNCHWGTLKLFYSEMEFLLLASKHIDIDKCLVLYVGAQPGFRLKYLFVKMFFPKIHMLLYDPRPFDIEEDENITIKTGSEGWFDDNKIDEVLKIANGRKILYISDIRLSDDDEYVKESLIHDDMQKQQKWGVMMGAEFMLLKFRMFFYSNSPKDIDFIDNTLPEQYSDKIVYKKNNEKHKSIHNWLLYLNGSIYTQLYAKPRSTESRLFVKKIKYHKDAKEYSEEDQEKYKMKYYDNLKYEGLFNYFNLKTRNEEVVYKKSDKLIRYLPGQKTSYTSASEYYIMRKYLLFAKERATFKNILNKIIEVYTFFNNKYNNNLIVCSSKNLDKIKRSKEESKYEEFKKQMEKVIDIYMSRCNKQFRYLKKSRLVDNNLRSKFIASFKTGNNPFFYIKDGKVIRKTEQIRNPRSTSQ